MAETGQTQGVGNAGIEVYLVPVCPNGDIDTVTLMVGIKLAGFIAGGEAPVAAWYYGVQTEPYAKPVRKEAADHLSHRMGKARASRMLTRAARCNSYGMGGNATRPEQAWADFLEHSARCRETGGALVIVGELRRLSLLAESGLHGEFRMVGNLQGGPLRQGMDDRPEGDIWRGTFSTETRRWVDPPVRLYSRH